MSPDKVKPTCGPGVKATDAKNKPLCSPGRATDEAKTKKKATKKKQK